MSPDVAKRRPVGIRWLPLCIGAFLTLTLGLSAHVLMMTVFKVPSPPDDMRSAAIHFINNCTIAAAALLIYQFSGLQIARIHLALRMLLLFVLTSMMAERLLRFPLMNGFVTTAWSFFLIANTPRLLPWLGMCIIVALVAPFATTWSRRLVAAVLVAAVTFQVIAPLTNALFAPVLAAAAPLQHAPVYGFPYGWQVTTAAYITYIEPVVTCLLATALMWPSLSRKLGLRIVFVTLLIVAIRGALLRPFAYAGFVSDHWLPIFISDAQFTLEAVVLGLLTALTWWLASDYGRGSKEAVPTQIARA